MSFSIFHKKFLRHFFPILALSLSSCGSPQRGNCPRSDTNEYVRCLGKIYPIGSLYEPLAKHLVKDGFVEDKPKIKRLKNIKGYVAGFYYKGNILDRISAGGYRITVKIDKHKKILGISNANGYSIGEQTLGVYNAKNYN